MTLTREQIEQFRAFAHGWQSPRASMDFWPRVRALCDMALRTEKAEAELTEAKRDAERLSAIEKRDVVLGSAGEGYWSVRHRDASAYAVSSWHTHESLRAAIDAAMAEGKPR
jgi:hypothetical protein